MKSTRLSNFSVGEQPPPIDLCYINEGDIAEEVHTNVVILEQNKLENNWKFYDLLSSICQDNNDSIIADGRQDGELIEQDVVEDMTETNDEVKRGKNTLTKKNIMRRRRG